MAASVMSLFTKKKKKKVPLRVPPLHLANRDDSDSSSTSSTEPLSEKEVMPTGARTAPANVVDYMPSCPKCGCLTSKEIRHWRFWKEWNTWIWHCSHVVPATHDMGPRFCGHMWIEENRRGRCYTCKTPMRIQECKKTVVFYCPGCNDYSQ